MRHRMETVEDLVEEELFVMMTLGDDRAVHATYVQGQKVHDRDHAPRELFRDDRGLLREPQIKVVLRHDRLGRRSER